MLRYGGRRTLFLNPHLPTMCRVSARISVRERPVSSSSGPVYLVRDMEGNLIDTTIAEIREISRGERITVAFSGGQDSTLVAALASEALGRDRVKLVNVCFGPYSYSRGLEIVVELADRLGLRLEFTPGYEAQEAVWKNGPSCNRCTRYAKLPSMRNSALGIIATGANQSDTWGQTGIALKDGFYAPIRGWDKKLIGMALEELKIHVPRIGEAPVREGCKLKHLLKIMANPSYHGYAVAISNEILLDCLESFPHTLANVKIAGPLSKNIALVNVSPLPPVELRERITAMLGRVEEIDEVRWIDGETKLKILANPGIYNSEEARYWIERGRLAPEFAFPVSFEWTRSTNRRLETFQVVDSWRL